MALLEVDLGELEVLRGCASGERKYTEGQERDWHGRFGSGGGGGSKAEENNHQLAVAMIGSRNFTHVSDQAREHAKDEIVAQRGADLAKAAHDNPDVRGDMIAKYGAMSGEGFDRAHLEQDWMDVQHAPFTARDVAGKDDETLYGEFKAQQYVDNWANTAADSDANALAMQVATAHELDAASPPFDALLGSVGGIGPIGASLSSAVNDIVSGEGATMQAFVRSEYNATQSFLKDHGVTGEVLLYRGMSFGRDDPPMPKDWVSGTQSPIQMNPASSWSVDKMTATSFGGMGGGGFPIAEHGADLALLTSRVKVEDIISTSRTGRGALSEGEVLVRNTPGMVATPKILPSLGQPEAHQPPMFDQFGMVIPAGYTTVQ